MAKKRKHAEGGDNCAQGAVPAEAAMKVICRSEIPEYLQGGQLFLSLNPDDDEEISVPTDVMKLDDSVRNVADLSHLLSTLRYWVVDNVPYSVMKYVLHHSPQMCAAVVQEFSEQFRILWSLQAIQRIPQKRRIAVAFTLGELEIIRFLHSEGCVMVTTCAVECARHGYTDCLRFYLQCGGTWPDNFESLAADSGHIECLQIYHNDSHAPTSDAAARAARYNQLACLQYFCAKGIQPTKVFCSIAAEFGSLDCLKYLHEEVGCVWENEVCSVAASCGNLDCLAYAHEHGCPWDVNVAILSAMHGHVDVLKYIHEHGGVWDAFVTAVATMENQIECLQYALENNCPIYDTIAFDAAHKGHLRCLQLLHEHGAPWGPETAAVAAKEDHLECLQYTVEIAKQYDSKRCVKYLTSVLATRNQ